jgi:hypothetical protein
MEDVLKDLGGKYIRVIFAKEKDDCQYNSKISEERVKEIEDRLKKYSNEKISKTLYFEGDKIYSPNDNKIYRKITERILVAEKMIIEIYRTEESNTFPNRLEYCREIEDLIDEYKIIDDNEDIRVQIHSITENKEKYRQITIEYIFKDRVSKIEDICGTLLKA